MKHAFCTVTVNYNSYITLKAKITITVLRVIYASYKKDRVVYSEITYRGSIFKVVSVHEGECQNRANAGTK